MPMENRILAKQRFNVFKVDDFIFQLNLNEAVELHELNELIQTFASFKTIRFQK